MKILLGEISSYKAIVIAKYIKENYPNICIHTYDFRKFTSTVKTKYSDKQHNIKKQDDYQYLNEISKIISDNHIDYFFPVINENVKTIMQNKVSFENCLDYLGDFEIFEKLNDKKQLMVLAEKLEINIPKTYQSFDEINYPCVIKPTNLSSAKGVKYIFNQADLEKVKKKYENQENILSQQYIAGIGVGYSVYAKNGEILVGYGHKRLAEYPVSGGSSVYRESYYDERMREIVEKILIAWSWTGFAMFEFKLSPQNELYLIEINPRIWGSINQGLQNGVNYFESMLGEVSTQKDNKIKTYLSPFIYYALLKYLFRLDFKHIIEFFRNHKVNKPDVSLFDDPKGYLSMILRKIL